MYVVGCTNLPTQKRHFKQPNKFKHPNNQKEINIEQNENHFYTVGCDGKEKP